MNRITVHSLSILLGMAAAALADPVVSFEGDQAVHTYNVTSAGGSLDAKLYVSNDPTTDGDWYLTWGVQAMDMYVQLGPGDSSAGPTFKAGPVSAPGNSPYVMNGADPITGTIFSDNPVAAAVDWGSPSFSQLLQISVYGTFASRFPPDLPNHQLLATFHITIPAGLALGSDWPIIIDGTGSMGLLPLSVGPTGSGYLDTQLFNANIHIVPEPTSITLECLAAAGLAGLAMCRCRARRLKALTA